MPRLAGIFGIRNYYTAPRLRLLCVAGIGPGNRKAQWRPYFELLSWRTHLRSRSSSYSGQSWETRNWHLEYQAGPCIFAWYTPTKDHPAESRRTELKILLFWLHLQTHPLLSLTISISMELRRNWQLNLEITQKLSKNQSQRCKRYVLATNGILPL